MHNYGTKDPGLLAILEMFKDFDGVDMTLEEAIDFRDFDLHAHIAECADFPCDWSIMVMEYRFNLRPEYSLAMAVNDLNWPTL